MNFIPDKSKRSTDLSLSDAYHAVWRAGGIVLDKAPLRTPIQNDTIAREIGEIFLKLDVVQAEDDVLARAVPGSSRIGLVALLEGVDEREKEILDYASLSTDDPVNPFTVHDERLEALASLNIAIQTAFYEKSGT
jgi:hypothetical protein